MTNEYKIGQFICAAPPIKLNEGRKTETILVENLGDRAIQIGSHYHFFEVNSALLFDRASSFGMRLNIPSGTAVRFEPGDEKEVELVEYGGLRRALGFNGLTNGDTVGEGVKEKALEVAKNKGFVKG